MTQQPSREKKIAQKLCENRAKSRIIRNLRNEVKNLQKNATKVQHNAQFEIKLQQEYYDAAIKVILAFHPIHTVRPKQISCGVGIYDMDDVFESFDLTYEEGHKQFDYHQQGALVRAFATLHNCAFYSEEKHNFSLIAAAEKAKAEFKKTVFVENLS